MRQSTRAVHSALDSNPTDTAGFVRWASNSRGLSSKTTRDYESWIRNASKWLYDHRAVELVGATRYDLQAFHETRAGKQARNNIRAALIAFFSYLQDHGLREDNPAQSLIRVKVKKGLPKPIPAEDVERLIATIRENRNPPGFVGTDSLGRTTTEPRSRADCRLEMWEAIVTVMFFQGLRVSEVTHIEWDDIVGDYLSIIQKGGRERRQPLVSRSKAALEKWRPHARPSRWVFPSLKTSRKFGQDPTPDIPISTNWVEHKVKEFGKRAGIPGAMTPHRARHTFATQLLQRSGDVTQVQIALGHASLQNTMIYAQVYNETLQKSMEALSYSTVTQAGPERLQDLLNQLDRHYVHEALQEFEPSVSRVIEEAAALESYRLGVGLVAPEERSAMVGEIAAQIAQEEQEGPGDFTPLDRLLRLVELQTDYEKWHGAYVERFSLLLGESVARGLSPNYRDLARTAAESTDLRAEMCAFGPDPEACSCEAR